MVRFFFFLSRLALQVLDVLSSTGLEASTTVIFFSDHGFALGERGQWGKRSLFESDARVPFIVADPRYPARHGTRAAALVELNTTCGMH